MSEKIKPGRNIQLTLPHTNNLTDLDTYLIPPILTGFKSDSCITDINEGNYQRVIIDIQVPKGATAHNEIFKFRNGTEIVLTDYHFGPIYAESKVIRRPGNTPNIYKGKVTFLGIQIL